MSLNKEQLFKGFSKLTQAERFARLLDLGALTKEDLEYLSSGGIKDTALAEHLIENVIGYFQLPLGVATNFRIDNQDYIIPLAVEETSIIAALSKTAKWIRQQGEIITSVSGACIIGQIQLAKVKNFKAFSEILHIHMPSLIEQINDGMLKSMVKRGGGISTFQLRQLKRLDGQEMAVIHIFMDPCNAMGANIINQVLENLKPFIEKLTGEKVTMCILSNLNDQKFVTAEVQINNVAAELGESIQEASFFAEIDPFRATTHNKGIMNGIDPVLIATGNDWRAVEAGLHAYAARDGSYKPLSKWRYIDGVLYGNLCAPIIVGVIGGVTAIHPTAKLCLRMMNISSANELSRVLAAVGLVQNLGALKALCTEGIIKGHMRLHINNLSLGAGATELEMPILQQRLQTCLNNNKRVSLNNACEILSEIRQQEKISL